MSKQPKAIDGLMRYLRDTKGIEISGSTQKRKLRNIGYYHGYKGYRYIINPTNQININNFDQLYAIYDFDAKLKSLFYPKVMFIETALKNYVLEVILRETNKDGFNEIYNMVLDNYKSFSTVGRTFRNADQREKAERKYNDELRKRLNFRDTVYRVITKAYSNDNNIAVHFTHKDLNVPIWGILELLSLGEFGYLVRCMNSDVRQKVSQTIGFRQSDDSNGYLTQKLIFIIKDLRNTIAHNDIAFDTRFKNSNIDNMVINAVKNETAINGINFNSIVDYLILIVFLLEKFKVPKTEMYRLITEFDKLKENLRLEIPINIYNQIFHTNTNNKLTLLKSYVQNR